MVRGIRATVQFMAADICPSIELSAIAELTIDSVGSTVRVTADAECVTEFSLDADIDHDGEVNHVFSHGEPHWYRYTHLGGIETTEWGIDVSLDSADVNGRCPADIGPCAIASDNQRDRRSRRPLRPSILRTH